MRRWAGPARDMLRRIIFQLQRPGWRITSPRTGSSTDGHRRPTSRQGPGTAFHLAARGRPHCFCRARRSNSGRGEDGGGQVNQVDGVAVGGLADLGAAVVAVGDHGGGAIGADGGEQDPLPAGLRNLVVAALEAEVPGQPAAARIEHHGLHAERRHHLTVGVEPQVGVLVAVHLDQRPRGGRRRCRRLLPSGSLGAGLLAERPSSSGSGPRGARVAAIRPDRQRGPDPVVGRPVRRRLGAGPGRADRVLLPGRRRSEAVSAPGAAAERLAGILGDVRLTARTRGMTWLEQDLNG